MSFLDIPEGTQEVHMSTGFESLKGKLLEQQAERPVAAAAAGRATVGGATAVPQAPVAKRKGKRLMDDSDDSDGYM